MTLKIQMVSLLLGIFFAYATALSVPETATTDGFSQKIQSGVHKLDTHFMKLLYNSTGPEENVFYSPLNIYTALSSLLLGASGATKSELISSLLELSQSDDLQSLQIHETLGKILDSIQHSQLANVSIGNGIFPQKGLKIKDNYQQSSKKYYKSEALPVDFAQGGNEATDIVNKWISDKTNNRIPKLFEGPISSTTRLLLASTIYFSATWQNKFPEGSTKLEKFNTGIKEVNVHTMNAKKTIPYINNPALQFEAISLPYLKNEFAMLITLPYANHSLIKLVNSLTPETYQNLIKEISPIRTYVDYKIPRLKFKWSQSINKIIKDLGAKKIFSDAELDKLIEGEHVSVSDVTHAAEIEVDEEGTVATAVTVIQFVKSSLMQIDIEEPIKFYVNRPFLLSIYHPETGVILFTGLVQNPAAN